MTMWRIRRMQPAPEGVATIACMAGEVPTQITLEDADTRTTQVIQICVDPSAGHCEPLHVLGATYSPNDWSDECP